MASRLKIPNNYAHADDMLGDPDIDAVYIAVPNTLHASLANAALGAGKHVLLDKPFALSSEQAQQVSETAIASGKTLMLGMNQRFDANVQRAQGEATVWLHPADADSLEIADGAEVELRNETGALRLRAARSDGVPKGVALSYKGRTRFVCVF